jgi:hypothetical protein
MLFYKEVVVATNTRFVRDELNLSRKEFFIREVWYGQRSLGETWWWWNFLVVSILLGQGLGYLMEVAVRETQSTFPAVLYLGLMLPVQIWIGVGTWRSATNHPSGWAIVAKVLTVVGVGFSLFLYFILFTL